MFAAHHGKCHTCGHDSAEDIVCGPGGSPPVRNQECHGIGGPASKASYFNVIAPCSMWRPKDRERTLHEHWKVTSRYVVQSDAGDLECVRISYSGRTGAVTLNYTCAVFVRQFVCIYDAGGGHRE